MGPQERVVYIVIDGMSTEALELVTASGRAPALDFIKRHGSYVRDSVAIFPTITPAATASLVTGVVPAVHRIPGMCWYDREAERFVNYGQSPRAAVVEGFKQVVHDVLKNLNHRHLNPEIETIHERLDRMGFTTASMNFMIFRGPHEHQVDKGVVKRMLLRKAIPESVRGPLELYFADIISGPTEADPGILNKRGAKARLSASDEWAAAITRELLEKEAADMILFYLHENDHCSHDKGPSAQLDALADADKNIAFVLDTYGSWEETLQKVGFVVTADHSQSPISDQDDHIASLEDILDDFSQVRTKRGKEQFGRCDVALAGNGRVGFIYLNEEKKDRLLQPVIEKLAEHVAIDQVIWRDGDAYCVRSDRGLLRFWAADGGGVVDERDNKWQYEGDLAALSGVVEEAMIRTPEYPMAMWRIKSALDLDRVGDVVVTTKLTYELTDLAGGHHRGGGDHASLHVQDSIVPFISTLSEPPLHPTTIDVVPHIIEHFERLRSG
jgi:hypothetical protein